MSIGTSAPPRPEQLSKTRWGRQRTNLPNPIPVSTPSKAKHSTTLGKKYRYSHSFFPFPKPRKEDNTTFRQIHMWIPQLQIPSSNAPPLTTNPYSGPSQPFCTLSSNGFYALALFTG